MSEQPTATAAPGAGGKKIFGLKPTTFYLMIGGALVAGLGLYWWRNYQAAQQNAASTASTAGSSTPVDQSGELSVIQTELEALLQQQGLTPAGSTSGSGGGGGWGNGGWSGDGGGSGDNGGGNGGSSSGGSTGINGNGSPPVSTAGNGGTKAPAMAPPNTSAAANGKQVVVKWGAVGGATGYRIQIAKPGGALWYDKTVPATSATFDVAPVKGVYHYKVCAVNAAGDGPWSPVKTVTVVA